MESKAALRREMRARLADLTPGQRADAATQFFQRATGWPVWREARTVLLTWSLPDELSATGLIEAALAEGKRVTLPGFDAASGEYVARYVKSPEKDLVVARFGVREPRVACPRVSFAELDLVIVPGVAFDAAGNRLGRGKGFYDRLLGQAIAADFCGIGFDEQIVPRVPVEPHDVQLHYLVTPSRLLCGRAAEC
ncbi:MAG TPA: 5-formyltetrahydrofolate cyclo-ligase [Candidatus Limnocylindria bacterium]|nr:5-formyltetrahydrofolate cyclo-ligase [Candidatus Limnocylindria bacterium]